MIPSTPVICNQHDEDCPQHCPHAQGHQAGYIIPSMFDPRPQTCDQKSFYCPFHDAHVICKEVNL